MHLGSIRVHQAQPQPLKPLWFSVLSRIFDKDDDGFISVEELRSIMKNLGDKMTDEELDEMLDTADTKHDGLINYSGII